MPSVCSHGLKGTAKTIGVSGLSWGHLRTMPKGIGLRAGFGRGKQGLERRNVFEGQVS